MKTLEQKIKENKDFILGKFPFFESKKKSTDKIDSKNNFNQWNDGFNKYGKTFRPIEIKLKTDV
jgi:hypothetical protein